MLSIKIEHKIFSFLEFYGWCGGSQWNSACQVFFDRGGGDPPIRDQIFTRKINFVKQNERNAATRGSGPEQTKGNMFSAKGNMLSLKGNTLDNPLPCSCLHEQGRGLGSVRQVQFWTPPKFRFSRFSKFQIFIVCVNATYGFRRQPRSKKTWQISMFFPRSCKFDSRSEKNMNKTVRKVMRNIQSSRGTARAVGARAHNWNMGSESIKFLYMSPRRWDVQEIENPLFFSVCIKFMKKIIKKSVGKN